MQTEQKGGGERKKERIFWYPHKKIQPKRAKKKRNHDSPAGRMAQTPRTGTGASMGRFGRYR